jgi:hypothetical protein
MNLNLHDDISLIFLFNQDHHGTNNLKLNYILRILHVDDNY